MAARLDTLKSDTAAAICWLLSFQACMALPAPGQNRYSSDILTLGVPGRTDRRGPEALAWADSLPG